MTENVDRFTNHFFDHLREIEEAAPLFKSSRMLDEAIKLEREHLLTMVRGSYDTAYAEAANAARPNLRRRRP